MPAKVAAYIAGGVCPPPFTHLKLAAISNAAPLHRADGPTVLFSTGYGIERQLTGLVEDLASHGFVVVAIHHPHDANIVAFPDGHTVSIGKVGESNAITRADRPHADTVVLSALTRLDRDRRNAFFRSSTSTTGSSATLRRHSSSDDAHRPPVDAGLDMDGFLRQVAAAGSPNHSCSSPPTQDSGTSQTSLGSGITYEDPATQSTSPAPPTSRSQTSSSSCPSWPA
jgi:hypothetical protein